MKKSNPISLFSFQDIITSLTGIMIVVVLIIALQLVESVVNVSRQVVVLPEYLELQKKLAELSQVRDEVRQSLESDAMSNEKFADISLEELKSKIAHEKKYSHVIKKQIQYYEKELQKLTAELVKLKSANEAVIQETRKLSTLENNIRVLQAQLNSLKHKQRKTKDEIQRKQKMLRFEFAGFDNQTPILIECSAGGFRCKRYPDGEVVVLGNPQAATGCKSQLSQLRSFLRSQDINSCYPVLLFKENALNFYNDIITEIYNMNKNIRIGKELITEEETVF